MGCCCFGCLEGVKERERESSVVSSISGCGEMESCVVDSRNLETSINGWMVR
jgi:hypothetical protein